MTIFFAKKSWLALAVCLCVLSTCAWASDMSIIDSLKQAFRAAPIPSHEQAQANTIIKTFSAPQLHASPSTQRFDVSDTKALYQAIASANLSGEPSVIYLDDGIYELEKTLVIKADDLMLLSKNKNPYKVTLKGRGMHKTQGVHNLITVRARNFTLDGITLSDAPNHLIQIAGESLATRPIIRNCILQDAYEQLLKVSYDYVKRPQNRADEGLVEHCIFQYTRGLAPNYYTGGIDALGASNWRVENNIFRDIASPGKRIAQHAIHFWVNAANNSIRHNIFIDNDRAIGFGMPLRKHAEQGFEYSHEGGLISENVIFHSDNQDLFADTGIVLEASPRTNIERNYVMLLHDYPRAIEYRFASSTDIQITQNQVNKAISSRDGAQATLIDNDTQLDTLRFFEALHKLMQQQSIQSLSAAYPVIQHSEQYND